MALLCIDFVVDVMFSFDGGLCFVVVAMAWVCHGWFMVGSTGLTVLCCPIRDVDVVFGTGGFVGE